MPIVSQLSVGDPNMFIVQATGVDFFEILFRNYLS